MIAVRNLAIARGGRLLVEELTFAVPPGGAAIVTGPNGAGKSSLLRVLAGLLRPHDGSVERTGAIAFLGEAGALDPEPPLAAALAFWARQDQRNHHPGKGRDPVAAVAATKRRPSSQTLSQRHDETAARVAAALAAVALDDLSDVPVRLLSTGQRRRAALARIVASGAPLWLLDEPTNGLDDAAVTRFEALIAAHRAGGGGVVVATHQPLDLPGAIAVRL